MTNFGRRHAAVPRAASAGMAALGILLAVGSGPAAADGIQPPVLLEVPLPTTVIDAVDAAAEAKGETAAEWLEDSIVAILNHPETVPAAPPPSAADRIAQTLDDNILDVPLPHVLLISVDQAAEKRGLKREEWLALAIEAAVAAPAAEDGASEGGGADTQAPPAP